MEKPLETSGECPYEDAGFFSRLFFWYAWPMIKRGAKEEVQYENMYRAPLSEDVTWAWMRLDSAWQKELKKKARGGTPSLRIAIARAFGCFYAAIGLLWLVEDSMRLLTPILLTYLIEYFNPETETTMFEAYLLATEMALSVIIQGMVGTTTVFLSSRCCIEWQAGTCGLIYRKVLRLSTNAIETTSSGLITDLIVSDAEEICENVWFLHGVWAGPFHLVVVLWFAYMHVGVSVFMALAVAAFMLPFQALFAKIVAHFKYLMYMETDHRVSMMGEIISGMRLIKMYCWENPFGTFVHKLRKKEILHNWHSRIFSTILTELNTFNQRFLTASVVLVYVWMNGQLTAAKVFPMFALFHVATETLLGTIPWGIKVWLQSGVSIRRIEKFLLLEEQENVQEEDMYSHDVHADPEVTITDLSASWALNAPRPTLSHITFTVGKGEMLAVVGEVGAGKSSLLLSVCGELPVSDGSVYCGGSIAYASQEPWVFCASIRQNILFGRKYEPKKYKNVLTACCLDKDLSVLPYHDQTLLAEKGLTLSGGQKARLGLARALYADVAVYLLDDPLSAVDPFVGKQLYDNCITGPLLQDKVVILVTHQVQYLQEAKKILVLNEGKVEGLGSYRGLQASGTDLDDLLPSDYDTETDAETETEDNEKRIRMPILHTKKASIDSKFEEEIGQLKKEASQHMIEEEREEEDRVVGSVGWRTYWGYFYAGNNVCTLFLVFLMCILTQGIYNIGDYWLSVWSHRTADTQMNSTCNLTITLPWECVDNQTSMYVYLVLLLLMLTSGIFRTWMLSKVTMNSSIRLHDRMYAAVVRAPIRFIDTNPKGRIINRFSADIGGIDINVPDRLEDFLQNFFVVLGSLVVMVLLNPYIAVACVPFILTLYFVLRYYLKIERQIQRLLAAGHSPVLTHLSASIEGVHTIRAFCVAKRMEKEFDAHYNSMCGAWFTQMSAFGWFQYHVNLTAALFCTISTFACLAVVDLKLFAMNPSQVGLTLSYITTIMWCTENAVRLSSKVEMQMVSAERVIRYTQIPPEAPLENKKEKPPPSWPAEGQITFDHVSFAYEVDAPMVLKNITCEIQAREKIGIAGRTGVGKSSLIQCLFRMAEPLGEIRIDGLPINNMGLHDLRGSIAIIPQDPVLFSGTMRRNLDPDEAKSDADVWKALEEVQLKSVISAMPGGLSAQIGERGVNLSVGQKQLFCLARALLRNNQILILDEGTANADKRTDALIQATIRDKFSSCTVLTIAHRLHTIMDSDRIMMLEDGQLREYDTPHALLHDPQGLLHAMVAQNGAQEQQWLTNLARQSHLANANTNS